MSTEITPSQPESALAGISLWAKLLLSRVQEGLQIEQARCMSGSRVSTDTITRYGNEHPDWYRNLMDAQHGSYTGQAITPSELAHARGAVVADHMADLAMTAKHERDQIQAGRLVMEVAGVIGSERSGAAVSPNIAIQIVVETPKQG